MLFLQIHQVGQTSQLLCSKSRVSQIKTVTVPRLELCAAALLAKLMNKVVKILKFPRGAIYYYSESTIAFCWIHKQSQTFVALRVFTIQSLSDMSHWFHVASADNPPDLVSS